MIHKLGGNLTYNYSLQLGKCMNLAYIDIVCFIFIEATLAEEHLSLSFHEVLVAMRYNTVRVCIRT